MAQSNFLSRLAKKECLRSVKNHPRYHLRMVAIGSAALGLFFNILAIAICKVKLLHGLAFLPLIISMIWHHVDLIAKRFFSNGLPLGLLALVDTLGFSVFLALIIVNGVIIGSKGFSWGRGGDAMLMTYTSVPWMVCCWSHGYIVLQAVWTILKSSQKSCLVCPNCSRGWKTKYTEPGKATDRADYSLLTENNDYEYKSDTDAATKHTDPEHDEEACLTLGSSV